MGIGFKLALSVAVAGVGAGGLGAQDIDGGLALPSKIYMLAESPSDLQTEAFARQQGLDNCYLRVDGNSTFERRVPEVTRLARIADGDTLCMRLVGRYDFLPVDSAKITLCVASPLPGAEKVRAQIIGDSFVQGSFYRTALVDSCFVPGLELVGLRALADGNGNADEGRGGWTLADYFKISKGELSPYAGFYQPDGPERYLGDVRFWQNVHKVMNGELKDFESRYQCGRFDKYAARFDAKTGYPVKPQKNDLVWDGERFRKFDGRKWAVAEIDESQWSFNYPKYLAMWDIETPDFLFETLGLNDFRYDLNVDYSDWDRMVTAMKDSFHKANPKGQFAIVIPCCSCGTLYNRRGDFTPFQNECMWRFRKHLTDTFDHREDEGFNLVDMGITIDNENGYRRDAGGLQTGNPHPYPNYPEMGKPLAAFIRYHLNSKQ